MAAPSVTYTFTNSTTADATQVNQNFTDLINGVSDGTKDLSIAALTVAGSATLNGNVTLGNASTDDLTVTASLASTIPIKTTGTYDIGGTTLGLRTAYFGNTSNSNTVGLKAGTTSSSYTLDLPTAAPSAGQFLKASSASALTFDSFKYQVTSIDNGDSPYTALSTDEVILADASSADVTINLPTAVGIGGKVYLIRCIDGTNDVIIDGNGSETIGGSTTKNLEMTGQFITIVSDNANWQILDFYVPPISAIYTTNAGQTLTNSSTTRINFEDQEHDPLSLVTIGASWVFTSPVSAIYDLDSLITSGFNVAVGDFVYLGAYVDGTLTKRRQIEFSATNTGNVQGINLSGKFLVNKGETLDVRANISVQTNATLLTSVGYNRIEISLDKLI